MAVSERMKVITSRCQSGQFNGSFGSSEGWGFYYDFLSNETPNLYLPLALHERGTISGTGTGGCLVVFLPV
ncbi:hypothetical protein RRF57_003869 [Xylaria bambusicola]|uniref:Uncharacterized protein n=1 Tax=Xylaria bambusicola TaxID=326684 RepID=A0AAN7ULP7_9PEZI